MSVASDDVMLVVGAGSIGERHILNLRRLGYANIVALRSRQLPLRNVDGSSIRTVTSWEQALEMRPKAAFVCTPTSMHLEQSCRCLEAGIHVLVEKPVSHTLQGQDRLLAAIRSTGAWFQVGYMMRHHPFVAQVSRWIRSGEHGRLVSFSSYWGEHLPNWHPWEDYRESYAAKKELGGGAALTLSHDLDLALHLAGSPLARHHLALNHRSSLEVDADSAADFLLEFENGITGHVHLNFFQKATRREYRFEFDDCSVHCRYLDNELDVIKGGGKTTIAYPDFERNQLFLDQTRDFIRNIGSRDVDSSLRNAADALRVVALCLGNPIKATP